MAVKYLRFTRATLLFDYSNSSKFELKGKSFKPKEMVGVRLLSEVNETQILKQRSHKSLFVF